jgi:hypothetical protein
MGLNDLAHLSIGGSVAESIETVREHLAESHATLIVFGESKGGFAQRARQAGENELRGSFVIPNVRAVAEAATALIVAALEAMELTVRGAEARLRNQRR